MRRLGLRARLVLVYAAAAVALMACGSAAVLQGLEHNLRASLDGTLAAQAAPYLQELAEPAAPDFTAAAPDAALSDPIAVVLDPDGAVVRAEPPGAAQIAMRAAVGSGTRMLDRVVEGEKVRLRVDRVRRSEGTWTVVVGTSRETTEEAAKKVRGVLTIAVPALLFAAVAGTWMLAGSALAPVDRMRAEADDLGAADATARLTVPEPRDELRALAVTFNDLLERLHQSLAQQRNLVADAGHELRTPLAILCTELELADRPGRSAEDLRAAVVAARGEAGRLASLAEDLLLLATHERRPTARVDLAAVAAAAAAARRGAADRRSIALHLAGPQTVWVEGDSATLRRALDNLLSNALDQASSAVTVGLQEGEGRILLQVRDDGPGFPAEFLPRAFDRFRRADLARSPADRHGAGLGLAIVAVIAASHGGWVHAENNDPGPGATVALGLPRPSHGPQTIARAP